MLVQPVEDLIDLFRREVLVVMPIEDHHPAVGHGGEEDPVHRCGVDGRGHHQVRNVQMIEKLYSREGGGVHAGT